MLRLNQEQTECFTEVLFLRGLSVTKSPEISHTSPLEFQKRAQCFKLYSGLPRSQKHAKLIRPNDLSHPPYLLLVMIRIYFDFFFYRILRETSPKVSWAMKEQPLSNKKIASGTLKQSQTACLVLVNYHRKSTVFHWMAWKLIIVNVLIYIYCLCVCQEALRATYGPLTEQQSRAALFLQKKHMHVWCNS